MGGLGNGRRGGRSPPLMIGALIACILVLGFNYWVSSSRNLELQTKLYELEGQVRRGAVERGAVELKKNEFQEEIQRQKEQIGHVESLYKRQLEGAQNACSQEKGTLLHNISSSAKNIQELKGQLNQLNDDLGKLQKELQGCQGNIQTLNNKLTYDMTHCNSQVLSQKELCDERVAAAKLEVQKKMEKLVVPPVQEHAAKAEGAAAAAGSDLLKPATDGSQTQSLAQPEGNGAADLPGSKATADKDAPADSTLAKDPPPPKEPHSAPSTAAAKRGAPPPLEGAAKPEPGETDAGKLSTKNLTEMEVMDAREEGAQTEGVDGRMEGMLIGKVDQTHAAEKVEDPDDYDTEEQAQVGADLEKQQQQQQSKRVENIDNDMEEEPADYNGDDENEGEFEADKQAELAQI